MVNEIEWSPSYTFETGIRETVKWYLANKRWWEKDYLRWVQKLL